MDNRNASYELKGVKLHGIHRYDGFNGEPTWKLDENVSEYNSYMADKQCIVPGKSLEELRVEFGIKLEE